MKSYIEEGDYRGDLLCLEGGRYFIDYEVTRHIKGLKARLSRKNTQIKKLKNELKALNNCFDNYRKSTITSHIRR